MACFEEGDRGADGKTRRDIIKNLIRNCKEWSNHDCLFLVDAFKERSRAWLYYGCIAGVMWGVMFVVDVVREGSRTWPRCGRAVVHFETFCARPLVIGELPNTCLSQHRKQSHGNHVKFVINS